MGLYYRPRSMWHVLTICITSVPKPYVTPLPFMIHHLLSEWQQPFEYNFDVGPAWRFVLKHLRWSKRLQGIADGYLRIIFEVAEHEPIPPVSTRPCFLALSHLH
jgi:hypothetical protein